MAESARRFSGAGEKRPRSRIQKKAPSSLQIAPVSDWNIAIPLLSPLIASPPSERIDWSAAAAAEDGNCGSDHRLHQIQAAAAAEQEKKIAAANAWQHPAAPFCYEPVPLMQSFVPV